MAMFYYDEYSDANENLWTDMQKVNHIPYQLSINEIWKLFCANISWNTEYRTKKSNILRVMIEDNTTTMKI